MADKAYQKYKVQWMLEHGYTLEDLLEKLGDVIQEELSFSGNPYVVLEEAMGIFEQDYCFKKNEMWMT